MRTILCVTLALLTACVDDEVPQDYVMYCPATPVDTLRNVTYHFYSKSGLQVYRRDGGTRSVFEQYSPSCSLREPRP